MKQQASDAKKEALTYAERNRVLVHLEDIVAFLEARCLTEPLRNYDQMFRMKYLPHDP
jgi:hypothetical protein